MTTGADGRFINLIEEILIQIDVFWKDEALSHYRLEESEMLEFKASIDCEIILLFFCHVPPSWKIVGPKVCAAVKEQTKKILLSK